MKKQFETKPNQKARNSPSGVLTIICSSKNGKRLEFKADFLKRIGYKEGAEIQLDYDDEIRCIDVGIYPAFGKNNNCFALSKSGTKLVLYSSGLVNELVKIFKLEYGHSVSKTFGNYKVRRKKKDGTTYGRIYMPEPEIIKESQAHGKEGTE